MNTDQYVSSKQHEACLSQASYDLSNVLNQLGNWLSGLDPATYQGQAGTHGAAPHKQTPGRHTRHIIDHFAALDIGMETTARTETPLIDYEQRQRQANLECQPEAARERIEYFKCRCLQWCLQGDQALRISHQTDQGDTLLDSSLSRELVFLSQHSIHHMAVIELLLRFSGLHVPDGFGINPSTRRFQDRQRQPAHPVSAS